MAMVLTDDQTRASIAIINWYHRDWQSGSYANPRIFTLHGYAGTGKTTLLQYVAEAIGPEAIFAAFTGKATSVIRRKTGHHAYTIHSLFKDYIGRDPKTRKPQFITTDEVKSPIPIENAILIIDEASMIGRRLAEDTILPFGCRVLAVGDPGQLDPVGDEPYFNTPDFFLETIVRQAADNPIIKASFEIRQTGRYTASPGFVDVMPLRDVSDDLVSSAGTLICATNETRRNINRQLRGLFGFSGELPRAGEKVMCLRNDKQEAIYNGAVYITAEDATNDLIVINGDLGKQYIPLDPKYFTGKAVLDDEGLVAFDFGYGLTVHKAQGSEWNTVILIDDHWNKRSDEYRKWLYTGVTRASERVIIAVP